MKDGYVQIPFPEELACGWFKDFCYYPNLTLDCLKDYAKKCVVEKAFKEGLNLSNGNHVSNVEFNNIAECLKYCFMRGEVVPQTRISESHKVWVCLNSITCAILTGECGCAAGLSETCKHVFALMHHVFLTVILPYLNMYYLQIPVSHILLKNLYMYFIKPSHYYHTQVQHQIYVIGVEYADFVVYLQKESCMIRIAHDPTYKEHSVPLLLNYFNLHVYSLNCLATIFVIITLPRM